MKIYKVYKSEDILKKSEKYILDKNKAVKYFNDLISEGEKTVATVKLSEKEMIRGISLYVNTFKQLVIQT